MKSDFSVEKPSEVGLSGQSNLRVKTLMVWIAVLALGLGWILEAARSDRVLRADQAVFVSWVAEMEKGHASLKPTGGMTAKTHGNFLELVRRCDFTFQTSTGKWITFQASLRAGPLSSDRRVTFDSSGRSVTWPFADIKHGRKIDLKAEFPEAFR